MRPWTRSRFAVLPLASVVACSDGASTTPAVTTPGAPTSVIATPASGGVTMTFAAPASNGGGSITGYLATCTAGAVAVSVSGAASPIVVSGLTNGTAYACVVAATNAAGTGAASGAVSVTPIGLPGAPTAVAATGTDGGATVTFTAPASTGGAAISGYVATCTAGGVSRTGTGAASPLTVGGLTNGTAYSCTVTAVNASGTGAASAPASVTPGAAATPPGVPTNVAGAGADATARLTFTAPASNGGSAITSYVASCTAGGIARTGTAATSPVLVTGLTNGTVYTCAVTALNAIGASAASATVQVTPVAPTIASTAGVGCTLTYSAFNSSPKINATSSYTWSCSATVRALAGTGIPDHSVVGGNFATPVSTQRVAVNFSLAPSYTGAVSNTTIPGYALNSVRFDPGTAGTCISTATSTAPGGGCVAAGGQDPWRIEALGGSFTFGTDENNAHVQPDGSYHYHGMPQGILTRANAGQAMTLVGWSVDGFPIYARYGYTVATSAASPIKVMRGSWQKKATPDAGRPSVSIFLMGTFQQDWEYVAGSGDLDECNGRTGVTPEFPTGIYHYYITDTYPYIQRCVKGVRPAGGGGPPPPPSR